MERIKVPQRKMYLTVLVLFPLLDARLTECEGEYCCPEMKGIVSKISASVVNGGQKNNSDICELTGNKPQEVVPNYLLNQFASYNIPDTN